MRVAVWFATSFCLLLCGCTLPQTSREQHIVDYGEEAWLVHDADLNVPVAISKSDIHALAKALDGHDQAKLEQMVAQGKAVEVIAGTRAKVIGESYNEREIRILDGPMANKTGWVPFEWLRPATVKAT
jgi:hypothetical protein